MPRVLSFFIVFITLTVWVLRRGLDRTDWRAPALSRNWFDVPLSSCTTCGLRIHKLPPPTILEGSWLLPHTRPAACSGYFSYATEQYRTAWWEQHRLAHYVKEDLAAGSSPPAPAAPPCAAQPRFTVTLIDDEAIHDCWYYSVHYFPVPVLKGRPDFPGIMKNRDSEVDAEARAGSTHALVVVLEDHPHYNLNVFKQADERIFRVVLEVNQVPVAQRALRRFLIAPYAATANSFLRAPSATGDSLLFFRGTCRNGDSDSSGMHLRHHIVAALKSASPPAVSESLPILASCTCAICPQAANHNSVLEDLARARFCLVIAGDTASSRRLSEIMAAGCIPVFVGPPWHTLPLSPFIDYFSFALFFLLEEQTWHRGDAERFEPDPWTAQLYGGSGVTRVANVEEMLRQLQTVSLAEVKYRRRGVAKYAPFFVSHARSNSGGSMLVNAVCAYINGGE